MCGKPEASPVRAKALACLSRREYGRAELESRLLGKGYSRGDVKAVLDDLESEALLSHERFVSDYIRSAERRGYGPSRIRWELRNRKKIGEDEIDAGMSESGIDWVACARRCYRKKFGGKAPGDEKEYLRHRGYLFRRGFPEDVIRVALSDETQRAGAEDAV